VVGASRDEQCFPVRFFCEPVIVNIGRNVRSDRGSPGFKFGNEHVQQRRKENEPSADRVYHSRRAFDEPATMAPPSLCGGSVSSRRGLLASIWSVVVCLTTISFIVALIFTLSADAQDDQYQQYDQAQQQQQQQGNSAAAGEKELAVTSRAMAFAAMWTAVLATLLAIFGAVVLGWQSPTGVYYTCCSPQVHRTTPLALGSFIGALLMFANMTLVCSILFGEFDVSSPFVFVLFSSDGRDLSLSPGCALTTMQLLNGWTRPDSRLQGRGRKRGPGKYCSATFVNGLFDHVHVPDRPVRWLCRTKFRL
jgi:hypothetical protein